MNFNGFKIEDYELICKTIFNSKYKSYSLEEYIEQKPLKDFIILRHDVDYNIFDAFKIAEIERSFDLSSTFYIRFNRKTTKENICLLKGISSEIGLHYDALAKTKNNVSEALAIFQNQLSFLNSIVNVKTVSAHGSSTKSWKNKDLLETINLKNYMLIGDAMLSINLEKIPYYSDAGRTWNCRQNKLNDYPDIETKYYKSVNNSIELCSLIKEEYYNGIYISSHPELWAHDYFTNLFKEIKYGQLRFLIKKFIKHLNQYLWK